MWGNGCTGHGALVYKGLTIVHIKKSMFFCEWGDGCPAWEAWSKKAEDWLLESAEVGTTKGGDNPSK
jgi:hypothetical protein